MNVQSNLPECVYSKEHLPEWPAKLLTPQSGGMFWGADMGFLSPSFLLCAVSLYPVKETLKTRAGRGKEKKKQKEVRDWWGSGRDEPGKHGIKHVRKQSPDRPEEATQNQCLRPLWGTLAEHKHRKFR